MTYEQAISLTVELKKLFPTVEFTDVSQAYCYECGHMNDGSWETTMTGLPEVDYERWVNTKGNIRREMKLTGHLNIY